MANGTSCFLEEEKWGNALMSTINKDTFSPRSSIGIFLGSQMTKMPGLFRDVTHAVCQQDTLSPVAQEALICRGLELKKYLKECRARFDELVATEGKKATDQGARFEILGLSLTVSVIVNRLLGAVWPSSRDALEDESLEMADELMNLDDRVGSGNAKVAFYLAQKSRIMDSTVRTTGIWRDRDDSERGKIIQKWKFDAWCAAIPRKVCDGKQCRARLPSPPTDPEDESEEDLLG
jgi:hypothetical protein